MHRNDPFCDDPLNVHKIVMPQNIFNFLKTTKNIEIQNIEPKLLVHAFKCIKLSEYPPPTGQVCGTS